MKDMLFWGIVALFNLICSRIESNPNWLRTTSAIVAGISIICFALHYWKTQKEDSCK
jgi:hypothetical protein